MRTELSVALATLMSMTSNSNEAGSKQPREQDDQDVIGAGAPGNSDGPVKDPEEWVTGDQPMTDAQKAYLDTLAKRAGETLPADMTKAEASENIDRLQGRQ